MAKKSLTLEDLNQAVREENIPLKRRLSSGDMPRNEHTPIVKFLLGRADAPNIFDGSTTLNGTSSNTECPHRICITEVAPSHSSFFGNENKDDWKMSINEFSSKKQGKSKRDVPKRIRTFYKNQDELITAFEDFHFGVDDAMEHAEEIAEKQKKASILAKATLVVNLCLLGAKLAAAILSGSISIISSLVDSCVDLSSGIVIAVTERAMKKRNLYEYPQGRTKLEPISIVILSVIMSLASIQLIVESAEKIVGIATGKGEWPDVGIITIVIVCSTIVLKIILFLVCRRVKTPSVDAMTKDHRNDVLSNIVAIVFGYIGSKSMYDQYKVSELVYLDPIGAILISLYILVGWWSTGYGQIKLLTGHTAKPDFLKKLTWICVNHHPKLLYVDTVRAFHFGINFLVEVDIVLPEDMTLKEAHDIGEPLQHKLECLPEVERAFVHLDYEFEHRPSDEHKQV
ncbi:uncharacterized protein LOC133204733 [Saccostrea echinata]|uniref:uncharacterized protein LOC133204733 n=1 Tax=Saccostrea echinata TaxID=191078 RepID=UPI002A823B40|nr:uncharacterized protein LOC133204733 [Saccostrea echinata]